MPDRPFQKLCRCIRYRKCLYTYHCAVIYVLRWGISKSRVYYSDSRVSRDRGTVIRKNHPSHCKLWAGDNSGPNVSQARNAIPHGPKRPKVRSHVLVPEFDESADLDGFSKNDRKPSDSSLCARMLTIDRVWNRGECGGGEFILLADGTGFVLDLRGR